MWFVSLALAASVLPAPAAEDEALTRMALCRDSWVEWQKSEPKKFAAFAARIRTGFTPHDNDPFALPKSQVSVLGLKVLEVYWESVGMGVGFSLTLDAPFDRTRNAVEKALGKPLQHCESGDGMRSCELAIAQQRTVTLMAEDGAKLHRTLIGCYYFYEK